MSPVSKIELMSFSVRDMFPASDSLEGRTESRSRRSYEQNLFKQPGQ